LEPALIVAFAGGSVSVGFGSDVAGDLQADLGDEGTSDRGSQQVEAFIFGLPLEDRERVFPTQLFLDSDDLSGGGSLIVGLFHDRLAIFAGLSQIDVNAVNVVTFVLQPTENDRGVKSAGISQYATGHGLLSVIGVRCSELEKGTGTFTG
jgi:hypothetical protein